MARTAIAGREGGAGHKGSAQTPPETPRGPSRVGLVQDQPRPSAGRRPRPPRLLPPRHVEPLRRAVREPEPDVRLLVLPVVRVRGLDPVPVRLLEGGEVPRVEGLADGCERLLLERREVLGVLRAGLRHRVEHLQRLPPLVPREVPVPALRGVVHHPVPPAERVHEGRPAREQVRALVDGELTVAALREDAAPRDFLVARHRLTLRRSLSRPRNPRSPPPRSRRSPPRALGTRGTRSPRARTAGPRS